MQALASINNPDDDPVTTLKCKRGLPQREIDFARTKAEQGKKRVYVRNSDLTGFVALITPKGSVSYLCEYRQNGKQHRIRLVSTVH